MEFQVVEPGGQRIVCVGSYFVVAVVYRLVEGEERGTTDKQLNWTCGGREIGFYRQWECLFLGQRMIMELVYCVGEETHFLA